MSEHLGLQFCDYCKKFVLLDAFGWRYCQCNSKPPAKGRASRALSRHPQETRVGNPAPGETA